MEELDKQGRKDALQESWLLEVLDSEFIIKFKEVYKTNRGKLCIVMEYADDGDIHKKILQQKETKIGTYQHEGTT